MPKKDLRQMKKDKLNKDDVTKATKDVDINANLDNMGDIKNIEDTIAHYQDKDEDELMGDLASMVSQGKQDGTFSNEMLEQFINNVSPMMDKDQRDKLKSITAMLKQKK